MKKIKTLDRIKKLLRDLSKIDGVPKDKIERFVDLRYTRLLNDFVNARDNREWKEYN